MRSRITVAYIVMDAWMLVGVTIRLYLQVSNGLIPDVLPFITAALAISAAIAVIATRRVPVGFYIALAAWDFVGSAARVTAQLAAHQSLDVLPAISVLVGVYGLVVLFLTPTSSPTSSEETQTDAQIHGR